MFYVIGTRSSRVAQQQLPGLACVHCHTIGSLWCAVFSRYFFVGFIPAFPLGKTVVTECQHCKQVLKGLPQLPAAYRPAVQEVLAAARTPLTHFALLFLVLALTVLPFLLVGGRLLLASVGFYRPAIQTDLPSEVVGNRYMYSYGPGKGYMLMEVKRVAPDSIYSVATSGLRGPLTPATATVALRDSVGPLRGFALGEWQQAITPQSGYKKL